MNRKILLTTLLFLTFTFQGMAQTSSGGFDRIETVIKSTGSTKVDGQTVANTGSAKDKGFVDGFLNNVASKVLTNTGGTAWAWSWTKKWTVGADGKASNVQETRQDGSLSMKGLNDPKAAAPSGTPQGPGSNPVSGSPSGPAANPTGTASNPGGNPGSSPGGKTPATPTKPGNTPGSTPGSTPTTSAPPPGFNPAPPKLPDSPPIQVVSLFIEDQRTSREQSFVSIETGFKATARPIPEDVRTRFSVELSPDIIKENVTVTMVHDSGETVFPNGTFPSPHFHIYRTPSEDQYSVTVTLATDGKSIEKLRVIVPVVPMGFQNRLIDSNQARVTDTDPKASQNFSTSSSSPSGSFDGSSANSPAQAPASSFARAGSPSGSGSSGSNGPDARVPDLSDLYGDSAAANSSPGTGQGDNTGSANSANTSAGAGSSADSGSLAADSSGNSGGAPDGQEMAAAPMTHQGGTSDNTGTPDAANGPSALSNGKEAGQDSGSRKADTGGSATGDGLGVKLSVDSSTPQESEDNFAKAKTTKKADANGSLLIVSVFSDAAQINQTYEYETNSAPTVPAITKDTSLSFSLNLGSTVKRDSVKIVIFDGIEKKEMPLQSIGGNVFDAQFAVPTNEAYVWIYGNTDDAPFSFKAAVPVGAGKKP